MAIFSKDLCQKKVETWLAAEEAVATGQEYQIGPRSLTRADLTAIRSELEYWAARLQEAEAAESGRGRNRVYRAVQRDL